ncbi:DUF2242 domain-containing protein [Paraburkholderia edwinii]|uniref:DUF2242 domain-containing protein n=1 Tax=Paraburkholderia edwinii TaxID=2861782 RepID=A0ABX8UZ51_9BURK|nr:DUF2242 domain-containing protein [Paraburkholderia edwinii]QYD72515.1 DUF2242 domain-containing protein [Paraburkholderia edwinii]
MLTRSSRFALVLLPGLAVALAACSSTPKPKLQDEFLSNETSPFMHTFTVSSAEACDSARRALLSQGYMTTAARPDTIDASKNFQPASDSHYTVEFHVVCTAGDDAVNSSVVYVNAVQNGYALKKSDTSASVGLSILGSVSLPIRSNSDAMVKISSETIQSDKFYDRFFDLVGRYLQASVRTAPVPGTTVDEKSLPGDPLPLPAPALVAAPATVTAPPTPVAALPVTATPAKALPAAAASNAVATSASAGAAMTPPISGTAAATTPATAAASEKAAAMAGTAAAVAPAAASDAAAASAALTPGLEPVVEHAGTASPASSPAIMPQSQPQ